MDIILWTIFISYIIYKIYNKYYKKNIYIEYLYDPKIILKRSTPESAGLDLISYDDYCIYPNENIIIPTGIKLKIPQGYFGYIADRSSMGKNNMKVLGQIIDSDYRGEIKIILHNLGKTSYNIKKYNKIAQIIFIKINISDPKITIINNNTIRGIKGFGSSGT